AGELCTVSGSGAVVGPRTAGEPRGARRCRRAVVGRPGPGRDRAGAPALARGPRDHGRDAPRDVGPREPERPGGRAHGNLLEPRVLLAGPRDRVPQRPARRRRPARARRDARRRRARRGNPRGSRCAGGGTARGSPRTRGTPRTRGAPRTRARPELASDPDRQGVARERRLAPGRDRAERAVTRRVGSAVEHRTTPVGGWWCLVGG